MTFEFELLGATPDDSSVEILESLTDKTSVKTGDLKHTTIRLFPKLMLVLQKDVDAPMPPAMKMKKVKRFTNVSIWLLMSYYPSDFYIQDNSFNVRKVTRCLLLIVCSFNSFSYHPGYKITVSNQKWIKLYIYIFFYFIFFLGGGGWIKNISNFLFDNSVFIQCFYWDR